MPQPTYLPIEYKHVYESLPWYYRDRYDINKLWSGYKTIFDV